MFLKKILFIKWNKWGSKKLFQMTVLVQLMRKNRFRHIRNAQIVSAANRGTHVR